MACFVDSTRRWLSPTRLKAPQRRLAFITRMTESETGQKPTAEPRASTQRTDIHLPRRRHASPWSNRVLLVFAVLVALVLAPLWLDPTLFAQLVGLSTSPAPSASASPVSSGAPSPSLSGLVISIPAF